MDFISNLATAAAIDLTQTIGANNLTINKQVYESTFAQLPEIASTNRSTLVQGFAEAFAQNTLDQASAGNMGPNLAGPLFALAYAAGLDDVLEVVFSAVSCCLLMPTEILQHNRMLQLSFKAVYPFCELCEQPCDVDIGKCFVLQITVTCWQQTIQAGTESSKDTQIVMDPQFIVYHNS